MELLDDLPAGTVIANRYTVVAILGQGGSGTVYRVQKQGQRRELALKLMHAQHPEGDSERQRIAREAELLRKLQHPNIVGLEDYGHTEDGRPYLVFPVLEGRTLKDRLSAEGALDFNVATRVATQVLRALEKAHSMGIAHRDLKPENIFLTSGVLGEMAQVLDFGLAKPSNDFEAGVTRAGTVLGTPRYMAPEQARAEEVTPSADVYSIGLIIGEMLTGHSLVDGANDVEIYVKQGSDQPLDLPVDVVRSPLGSVVARAVDKNPAVRYRQAGQMLADMRAITERMGQAEPSATEADLEATCMIDPAAAMSLSRPTEMSEKLRQAFNKAASKSPPSSGQPPGPPPPSSQPAGPPPPSSQPANPPAPAAAAEPVPSVIIGGNNPSPAPPPSYPQGGPQSQPSYPQGGPQSQPSYPQNGPQSQPSYPQGGPQSQPSYPQSGPQSHPGGGPVMASTSVEVPAAIAAASTAEPTKRGSGKSIVALLVVSVAVVAAIAIFAIVRLR